MFCLFSRPNADQSHAHFESWSPAVADHSNLRSPVDICGELNPLYLLHKNVRSNPSRKCHHTYAHILPPIRVCCFLWCAGRFHCRRLGFVDSAKFRVAKNLLCFDSCVLAFPAQRPYPTSKVPRIRVSCLHLFDLAVMLCFELSYSEYAWCVLMWSGGSRF